MNNTRPVERNLITAAIKLKAAIREVEDMLDSIHGAVTELENRRKNDTEADNASDN